MIFVTSDCVCAFRLAEHRQCMQYMLYNVSLVYIMYCRCIIIHSMTSEFSSVECFSRLFY